ncbi:MAG: hypothetical protein C0598_00665 [Marinilabiliales bacterium]|nr:MAG: hypothetical protein C0598_00665 [Marinilabiliales bacterium]
MKPIFQIISILIIITIVESCNFNSKSQPKSLKELHSTFTEEELKPEINNLDKDHLTFIATGHLYPLLNFPQFYDSLIATIKKQNPDYVFYLGDMVFNNTQEEWNSVFDYNNEIKDIIYFSPGNHDLNFHYERYEGDITNQNTAELRYLENVGYRYKLIKDNHANFLLINMNDSLERIAEYVSLIKPKIDNDKPVFVMSSQSAWHNGQQNPEDVRTWPLKSFDKDEILTVIRFGDNLVHGDWNKKFYRSTFYNKGNGTFNVFSVGNRKKGDSLYIAKFDVFKDTVITNAIFIPTPDSCKWYNK